MPKSKDEAWIEAFALDLRIRELESVWTARYNEIYTKAPLLQAGTLEPLNKSLRIARAKLSRIMLNNEYGFDYRELPTHQAPEM